MEQENKNSYFIRKLLQYAAVLTAVCLCSGAGLSLLYVLSAERIEKQEEKAFQQTLEKVLGEASEPEEIVEGKLWKAHRPEEGVRYVAEGSARGYQSDIVVLVSADADADRTPLPADSSLHRMAVLSSAETPGLGENINLVRRTVSLWQALLGQREEPGRPWFQTQFEGKSMEDLRITEKDGRIDTVTGATETSEAATKAARRALQTIIDKTEELYQ